MTGRGEANLKQCVRQALVIHVFIQPDKAPGHLEGVFKRHGELQFLVQVVNGAVKGLTALQHQVRPFFETMGQRGHFGQ